MLAGALFTHKRDCLQDMTVEATLIGDSHFEVLGKHRMYTFKRNGGMGRFGKDCRLRSVTEEMLGFLQITDVAKDVFE